jgi:hypothetical protein
MERRPTPRAGSRRGDTLRVLVTLVWFIVWLIANNVGGHEPLKFDPVNAWTATLILAIALDLGGSYARSAGGR